MTTITSEAETAEATETPVAHGTDGQTPKETGADITASHPSNHQRPYLIPKAPPPKAEKRWNHTELPPLDTWVKIITKRDTFTGRVTIAEPDRIRLKEGAGYWEIPMHGIQSITPAPDPRDRRRAKQGDAPKEPAPEPELIED
jgi:hypothetical protein